jgi:hypothetical protein
MTKQEFDNAFNALEKRYYDATEQLYIEYAKSNNPCKVGDIIEDYIGKGKIIRQDVTRHYHDKRSSMFYECIELKKDGTPRKKETLRTFYQCNLKSINGKPYKFDE